MKREEVRKEKGLNPTLADGRRRKKKKGEEHGRMDSCAASLL